MISRPRLLLMLMLAAGGCSESPREKAETRLRKADATRLRLDAAILYKNLFASEVPSYLVVKIGAWPASFRAIEPSQVGAYRDGFTLACQQGGGVESGIYVVPAGMDVLPQSKGRARFERIADGIYWYSFEP